MLTPKHVQKMKQGKFLYSEVNKILEAIIELENCFKETGIHTKIISEYTGINIRRVNAIAIGFVHSEMFSIDLISINHKYEAVSTNEFSSLPSSHRKDISLYTQGFMFFYKDSEL